MLVRYIQLHKIIYVGSIDDTSDNAALEKLDRVLPMKKITVIIPVYNTEKYLDKCLASVTGQTYKNLEIILVDDGSTDNSYSVCQKWAEADNRIRLLQKENGGQSSARNMALDIATGDYIAFVDSDDWLEPDMYEVMLQVLLDTGKEVAMCNVDPKVCNDDTIYFQIIRDHVGSQLWRFLFTANLWDHIRLPLGRYAEDMSVLHEVLYQKSMALIYHDYYFYYSENPENSSNLFQNRLKNVADRATAFIMRYKWILKNNIDKESGEIVLDKVAYFIIATMGRYVAQRDKAFQKDVAEMLSFSKEHYWEILKNKHSSLAKKIAITIINISPKFYYRIRHLKPVR